LFGNREGDAIQRRRFHLECFIGSTKAFLPDGGLQAQCHAMPDPAGFASLCVLRAFALKKTFCGGFAINNGETLG